VKYSPNAQENLKLKLDRARASNILMWKKPTGVNIAIVLCIVGAYATVVMRGTTENSRRSLALRDETSAPNHVVVSVLVTGVNLVTHELTSQLEFQLAGDIARDEVTPAADLTVLLNNARGQEEFDFPRGKRIVHITAVFPLDGNLNNYPFDQYESAIRLLITTPRTANKTQASAAHEDQPEAVHLAEELVVGTVALERSEQLPLSFVVTADIPGIKFAGRVTRNEGTQLTGIGLKLRRADSVISVSVLINAMITCLAVSVLGMVLRVTASTVESDLLPLSMAISLIFGLPALRNVQPGVPPVGAFSDYVVFIWAELIVAACAVIIVWHWLLRSPESRS
jgi:Domain of unknown function (DUF4436)